MKQSTLLLLAAFGMVIAVGCDYRVHPYPGTDGPRSASEPGFVDEGGIPQSPTLLAANR